MIKRLGLWLLTKGRKDQRGVPEIRRYTWIDDSQFRFLYAVVAGGLGVIAITLIMIAIWFASSYARPAGDRILDIVVLASILIALHIALTLFALASYASKPR